MVEISSVTVTYNRPEAIRECVRSLKTQTLDDDEYEIIVINQGDDDLQLDVDKYIDAEDEGVSYGRNLGIEEAEGDIIAFVDDDCVPHEDWLEKGLKEIKKQNAEGIEGCIRDDSGHLGVYQNDDLRGYVTANIIYKKNALEEVGCFDKRFNPLYREDTDLAWKILENGGSIEFSEDVVVFHQPEEDSTRDWKKNRFDVLLYDKHPEKFSKFVENYAIRELPIVFLGWIYGCLQFKKPPTIFLHCYKPFLRKMREMKD